MTTRRHAIVRIADPDDGGHGPDPLFRPEGLRLRPGDERRRRDRLERRIAEVRRWLGAALDDGRQVEAAFGEISDRMTPEEREEFLQRFLESCGAVVRVANRRMCRAFVESVDEGEEHAPRPR